MNNKEINKKMIEQIKRYTSPDGKTTDDIIEYVKANSISKKEKTLFSFARDGWKTTVVAGFGVFIILGVVYSGITISSRNNNIIENNVDNAEKSVEMVEQVINVENDIDVVGMSGKELLKTVNINSYKDIDKMVIRQNELDDLTWVEKVKDITIHESNDIKDFYDNISNLIIQEESIETNDEWEINSPKEREILLYCSDGTVQRVHYDPSSNCLMECFYKGNNPIPQKSFDRLSDDFNKWLINICNIDIEKDYSDEYKRYQDIQNDLDLLQKYNEEKWFGGYDLIFENGVLKIKVLLLDDNKRDTILNSLTHDENIVFGNEVEN
jgi:hypothetical protein